MPHIVTIRKPLDGRTDRMVTPSDTPPRAVATLDEVFPVALSDGTVIEARELHADDLRGLPQEMIDRGDIFELVAAYNAQVAAYNAQAS